MAPPHVIHTHVVESQSPLERPADAAAPASTLRWSADPTQDRGPARGRVRAGDARPPAVAIATRDVRACARAHELDEP